MQWKTHRLLANKIFEGLGYSDPGLKQSFLNGIVAPDQTKETEVATNYKGKQYVKIVSHHNAKHDLILKHLMRSRTSFIKGNRSGGFYSLGCALHYVQDKCVSKGFLGLFHDSIEDSISSAHIDSDNIRNGATNPPEMYSQVCNVIKQINPSSKPQAIINHAAFISTVLAAAVVFKPSKIPQKIVDKYRKLRKFNIFFWRPFLIGGGIILGLYDKSIPFAIFNCVIAFAVFTIIDFGYSKARNEARWFGLAK